MIPFLCVFYETIKVKNKDIYIFECLCTYQSFKTIFSSKFSVHSFALLPH